MIAHDLYLGWYGEIVPFCLVEGEPWVCKTVEGVTLPLLMDDDQKVWTITGPAPEFDDRGLATVSTKDWIEDPCALRRLPSGTVAFTDDGSRVIVP